jgi:hypothetical protein
MGTGIGMWNVRGLYWVGSLMTVSRELPIYIKVRFSGSAGSQMG